jgi:transcriptional regulator with XRE-family HTH domain
MNNFSGNLKFLRNKLKLSQENLSEITGIKKSSIGAYEEKRSQPNLDKLIILSTALQISIDSLIKEKLF